MHTDSGVQEGRQDIGHSAKRHVECLEAVLVDSYQTVRKKSSLFDCSELLTRFNKPWRCWDMLIVLMEAFH